MITQVVAAVTAARFFLPSVGGQPDPCALVSPAEITAALGEAPSAGRAIGPEPDEDTGAMVSACSLDVGDVALTIAIAEFESPRAADGALSTMARLAAEEEEAIKLAPQSDLGDRAMWGASSHGTMWVALKGKYLLNLTLTGNIGDGTRLHATLKRLAGQALAKL